MHAIITDHRIEPVSSPSPGPDGVASANLVRALYEANRPVLLLSAHNALDMTQVLTSATPSTLDARLVVVGAPPLREGFNLIRIHFGSAGLPVGCEIERWRYRQRTRLVRTLERAPLWSGMRATIARLPEAAKDYYQSLPPGPITGMDLAASIMNKPDVRLDEIPEPLGAEHMWRLKELEWHGLVQLRNTDRDFAHWSIRKGL